MKSYELIEHTADFCIKVKADTLCGIFETAAKGLLANIFNEVRLGEETEKVSFTVSGESNEEILVKFLNDLLYMFYVRKMLPKGKFSSIQLNAGSLTAEAVFSRVKSFSADFEVKAVTYGGLAIKYDDKLYETTVIADV